MGAAVTLPAIGEFIGSNPFTAAIAGRLGAGLFNRLFAEESPFATGIEQRLQAGNQLIPQLQAQARGESGAASRNIGQQLRQQTTSRQQSFAAGATARGGGGTPVAAQLDRFRGDEQQALGNALAQLQANAQNALLGLGQTGLEGQNLLEIETARNNAQFANEIADFFGRREERKQLKPVLDEASGQILDPVEVGFRIEKATLEALGLPSRDGLFGTSEFA